MDAAVRRGTVSRIQESVMAKPNKAELEAEIVELRQRVEKLEALLEKALKANAAATSVMAAPKPAVQQEIAPEIVLAITAAVAAFLGKRASIHQIRLTGTTAWAQQGRASVQASHGVGVVRSTW